MIYNNKSSNTVHIVRSYRAICVGIDDNIKRSPIWFNLDTKHECICSNFLSLPMGDDIVEEINNLSHEPPLELSNYDDNIIVEDDMVEADILEEIDETLPNSQELEVINDRESINDPSTDESSDESSDEEYFDTQDQSHEDVPSEEQSQLLEEVDVQLGTEVEDEEPTDQQVVLPPPVSEYRR